MKYLRIFALLAAFNAGAWIIPQATSAQQVSVSFQFFYDELSPYGMWVDYPNYGYVWIPNGDSGFSPYATAGYWVFTDDGWTWVSDYPWGWAAFHYGRWDYDNVYGWFWVPDYEWAPAWVSWRRSPGYYGWAPLRPGISMSIAFGGGYHERNERWIFIRDRDIARHDIGSHYINRTNNVTIINNSTVITNTQKDSKRNATYIAGPNRDDVQKITNTTVKPVAIRENDQPGQHLTNSELQIYRPQVQKANGNENTLAPSKVMKLNDVKPISERNTGSLQQQPRTVNPSNKIQASQPQNVALPNKIQPTHPQNVNSTNNKAKQTQNVALSNKNQPSQPRVDNSSNSRGKGKQPRNVAQPNKGQPQQPRNVNPSKKSQSTRPQNVNPSKNGGREQQPQNVNSSNNNGREQRPQNVAPPNKNSEPQPKTNQDEKDKR